MRISNPTNNIKIVVWRLVDMYQCFGWTWCFHPEGWNNSIDMISFFMSFVELLCILYALMMWNFTVVQYLSVFSKKSNHKIAVLLPVTLFLKKISPWKLMSVVHLPVMWDEHCLMLVSASYWIKQCHTQTRIRTARIKTDELVSF